MGFEFQWEFFCSCMLSVALASYVLRCVFLAAMKNSSKGIVASKPISSNQGALHPAELAYLFRPGDSAHCLIVLVVDLLQKRLKSAITSDDQIVDLHYEKVIWNFLTEYLKGWTFQQAQNLVPEIGTRNPIKIALGFWRLRDCLGNSFKSLVSDLIKDPLSLRKYFSPAGLVRVIMSILSSGVKEPLMNSLRDALLSRELLVPEAVGRKFSGFFSAIACIHFLLIILLPVAFRYGNNWAAITLFLCAALLNGFILRLLAGLPSLLPFYDEITLVLDSLGRTGFRIRLLRGVLKLLRSIFWLIIVAGAFSLISLQAAGLAYLLHFENGSWQISFLCLTLQSLSAALATGLFFLSIRVAVSEQRSHDGDELIKSYQTQLRTVSPIMAFSATLADSQYKEQFSNIVALYGIETLFLLA